MLIRSIILTLFLVALSGPTLARDTKHLFPISDAMSTSGATEKLNKDIKFYFGEAAPSHGRSMGSFVANRKTNAFNKSDKGACEWAFLSAMLALQQRAIDTGGNAVTNIHSFYKKQAMHSEESYECHAGGIMAGVALQGTVVKQ